MTSMNFAGTFFHCLQLWILKAVSQHFNVLDCPIGKYAENDLKKKKTSGSQICFILFLIEHRQEKKYIT